MKRIDANDIRAGDRIRYVEEFTAARNTQQLSDSFNDGEHFLIERPGSVDTEPPQILPGQELDGGTVIASVYLNDTEYKEPLVLALLLMPTPGEHYRMVDVWETSREVVQRSGFPNIVPAVEAYVDNGGDY